MNKRFFYEGTRVKGLFHGVPYTGTVVLCRPHSIHPRRVEMIVKFDEPIDCGFWGVRDIGLITAFYEPEEHTIEELQD